MADYSIIRNYGITCYGENIIDRFYDPSHQELLEEIGHGLDLNIEIASKPNDPGYAVSMFNWAPRALCYAVTGKLVSKSEAAEWYISEFPDTKWTPLVAHSKEFRYPLLSDDLEKLNPLILSEVTDFLICVRKLLYRYCKGNIY